MKKTCTLLFLIIFTLAACTKKYNTTNNYYTVPSSAQPAFIVEGISNISLTNDVLGSSSLSITVAYQDSAQQNVSLAVSGLPAGVVMDTTWARHGIPTFSTTLTIYDTNATGATPGTYPLTLTATNDSGNVKIYPFTLKISPMPTTFLGAYTDCTSSCGGIVYTDSLYIDPAIQNKVWFTNFDNSGHSVYGLIQGSSILTIPAQTISGVTYSTPGTGPIELNLHQLNLQVIIGSSVCNLNME